MSVKQVILTVQIQSTHLLSSISIVSDQSINLNLTICVYMDRCTVLPVDVRILTTKSELIAGRKVDVRCETAGSKPAANIRWLKNNISLPHSR